MTSRSRLETLFTAAAAVVVLAIAALPAGGCIGVSAKPTAGPGGTAPVKRCRATRPADDGALDDFEDGNTQLTKSSGRDGYWFSAKDPKGSTIEMQTQEPGAGGSELAMHMSGTTAEGTAEGGSWGVQLGANFINEQGSLYDASKYAGFSFKAKVAPGSSKKVRFKIGDVNTHKDAGICTTCWNHFGKDLVLSEEWKEYKVMFSTADQEPGWGSPRPASVTPAKLIGINWSVGPNQAYDMWFDDLTFLDCE
jgi:endoglucanase